MDVATFFYEISDGLANFVQSIISDWNYYLSVLGLHLNDGYAFLETILAIIVFYFFLKVVSDFVFPL